MKTHKVRPVLVESKEKTNLLINTLNNRLLFGVQNIIKEYAKYYELILISLEDEKIESGDTVYELYPDGGFGATGNHLSVCTNPDGYDEDAFKVIARQSQIPPEYISEFIEQYNNDCVEDFEIKCGGSYEEFLDFCGKLGYDYDGAFGWYKRTDPGGNRPNTSKLEDLFNKYPKLTNGFVTVIEKEPISYTEEEVLNLIFKYSNDLLDRTDPFLDAFENESATNFTKEWFKENKKNN